MVHAGGINGNGELRVVIARTAADNTVARIIHMVEEAQAAKAPTARFIDRFSRWYTPAALVVSALVVTGPPLLLGCGLVHLDLSRPGVAADRLPLRAGDLDPRGHRLGALAAGARHGLLVKGGAALEAIGGVRTVAFDKTGTLTAGRPRVTDVIARAGAEPTLLGLAAAVETRREPPARPRRSWREPSERGLAAAARPATQRAVPGKGIARRGDGRSSPSARPRHGRAARPGRDALADGSRAAGRRGQDRRRRGDRAERPIGLIALRDEPRPDAAAGIAALRSGCARSC